MSKTKNNNSTRSTKQAENTQNAVRKSASKDKNARLKSRIVNNTNKNTGVEEMLTLLVSRLEKEMNAKKNINKQKQVTNVKHKTIVINKKKVKRNSAKAYPVNDDITARIKLLANELRELWDLPKGIHFNSYEFILRAIKKSSQPKSGLSLEISLWTPRMVQQAITISKLLSKVKEIHPIESSTATIDKFIDTQIVPILSTSLMEKIRIRIQHAFKGFDYQAVVDAVNDIERPKIITNGSAYPPILAPHYVGDNTMMLCGIAHGRKIFWSDFKVEDAIEAPFDGKMITVPKNNKSGRGITLTNRTMINNQLIIDGFLRDHITRRSKKLRGKGRHIIQFDDQTVQHSLLVEGNATIDLQSASDRVYVKLINYVWPEFMEYFGQYLPKNIYANDKEVKLTCIGTQGFPLTFTIMSIICGMIVEAVKTSNTISSNYGDDIIVAESDYEEIHNALQSVGLRVNTQKSHLSSDNFLESCGMDVYFNRYGQHDITPPYLRGISDVSFILFFTQLTAKRLIDPLEAVSIMDKLGIKYFAYEYEYQVTEFHYNYGEIRNVGKPIFDTLLQKHVFTAPYIKNEVSGIKGLNRIDSNIVIELLKIDSLVTSGADDHVLFSYKQYPLYTELNTVEHMLYYEELETKYSVSFSAIIAYKFIKNELWRYKYSVEGYKFTSVENFDMRDFIDQTMVTNTRIYPIYRYVKKLDVKKIDHPNVIIDDK